MKSFRKNARETLKRYINAALRPVGVRLLTQNEIKAIERTSSELVAVYENVVLPELPPRRGRSALIHQLLGTQIPEAMYLIHHLHHALKGAGDICEMGIAQGATSVLIANEISDTDRRLWLYDSFEGLSEPTDEDILIDDIFELGSMDRYAHSMAFTPQHVKSRLRSIDFPPDRTRVIPGFICRDLDPTCLPKTVAFAYIDFDLYEPILVGLELMHPRCRPDSILMVDDYRFFSAGAEAAVKEFMAAHPDSYDLWEAPPHVGYFCVLRRRTEPPDSA